MDKSANLDKIDKRIIELLQENARYPLKYLASEVFLSSPAVSSRIERLEKSGIIKGYHATIDPISLGYHITAFINLSLDPKQKPEFYPFISACPNVLECDCVTGNFSMHMKVCFPSTQELDTFIGQLQQFGNTETQIVFSTPVEMRGISIESDSSEKETN
jgi:Lrp/AsnC family leucine-responsive transcriptional regulator